MFKNIVGFGNIFRVIDELTTIKNCAEFRKCFQDIHFLGLEIMKRNIGYLKISFLHLMITVTFKKPIHKGF